MVKINSPEVKRVKRILERSQPFKLIVPPGLYKLIQKEFGRDKMDGFIKSEKLAKE